MFVLKIEGADLVARPWGLNRERAARAELRIPLAAISAVEIPRQVRRAEAGYLRRTETRGGDEPTAPGLIADEILTVRLDGQSHRQLDLTLHDANAAAELIRKAIAD